MLAVNTWSKARKLRASTLPAVAASKTIRPSDAT
jgi:hypothetical protein